MTPQDIERATYLASILEATMTEVTGSANRADWLVVVGALAGNVIAASDDPEKALATIVTIAEGLLK